MVQPGPGKAADFMMNASSERLDPRADETVLGTSPAIGEEHVVEQHAGIRSSISSALCIAFEVSPILWP